VGTRPTVDDGTKANLEVHILDFGQNIYRRTIDVVFRKRIVPIAREGNILRVATCDPFDLYAMDDVRMTTGLQIDTVLAIKDDIEKLIKTRLARVCLSDCTLGLDEDLRILRVVRGLIERDLVQRDRLGRLL
jgi:hypothetical protein